jgi:YVTN family beta-propeller protein
LNVDYGGHWNVARRIKHLLSTQHSALSILLLGVCFILSGLVAQAQQEAQPLYALPASNVRVFSSGSIALSADGRILVSANLLNNTVSIIRPNVGEVLAEIPVGTDPRTVTLTPDAARVLVVNRGDGTLSVVSIEQQAVINLFPLGVLPYAVVSDSNDFAYVSLQGEDAVIRIDLNNGEILDRYAVPESPAGLALWGDFLYVTHLWSGQFSLVYLPQKSVARTINTGFDTSLSQAIEIDSSVGVAYLPQSRSNAQTTTLTYDTAIWPVVNRIDLANMGVLRQERVALDTADRPVNMPFAAAVDRTRRTLYVVNAGSNDLSVIDLDTGLTRAHVEVGANPRGVLLSRDSQTVFVHNALDGTITSVETRGYRVTDVLPISASTIPADILIGAQLFHSSEDPRLSENRWTSCASCHFDGQSDGRTWRGFPGGARNTPLLFDLLNTAPYTWTGGWDELADVDFKIRGVLAGTGLIEDNLNPSLGDPHAGLSLDMDALATYLATLTGPPNPTQVDEALVERGEIIFVEQGCGECHAENAGANLGQFEVGTGGEFDIPSLHWLWMSAPYFHDGRAATLYDVFTLPTDHQLIRTLPAEDIDALVTYLLAQ